MDDFSFDNIAKAVVATNSRRGILRLLVCGLTARFVSPSGALWPASRDVAARKHKRKKKKACAGDKGSCGDRHACPFGGGCPNGQECCGTDVQTGKCCSHGRKCFNGECCTPCGGPNGPCCAQEFVGGICCKGQCHLPCLDGWALDPRTCRCECYHVLGGRVGVEQVCCPPGLTDCGNQCVDTLSDDQNCGTCGNACGAGESCCGGECCDRCECENGQCTHNWFVCGSGCCFQGYTCCPDVPFCCSPDKPVCSGTGGCKYS